MLGRLGPPVVVVSTALGSASRFLVLALRRQVHLRKDRLGAVAEDERGDTYTVLRETCLVSGQSVGGAALLVWFQLRGVRPDTPLRNAVFWKVNHGTTPFFSGVPGFRFKLWTEAIGQAHYLGIYEFASPQTADACGAYLTQILRVLSVPGTVAYSVEATSSASRYLSPPSGRGESVPQPGAPDL